MSLQSTKRNDQKSNKQDTRRMRDRSGRDRARHCGRQGLSYFRYRHFELRALDILLKKNYTLKDEY